MHSAHWHFFYGQLCLLLHNRYRKVRLQADLVNLVHLQFINFQVKKELVMVWDHCWLPLQAVIIWDKENGKPDYLRWLSFPKTTQFSSALYFNGKLLLPEKKTEMM